MDVESSRKEGSSERKAPVGALTIENSRREGSSEVQQPEKKAPVGAITIENSRREGSSEVQQPEKKAPVGALTIENSRKEGSTVAGSAINIRALPKTNDDDEPPLIPPSPKGSFRADKNTTLKKVVEQTEGDPLIPPSPRGSKKDLKADVTKGVSSPPRMRVTSPSRIVTDSDGTDVVEELQVLMSPSKLAANRPVIAMPSTHKMDAEREYVEEEKKRKLKEEEEEKKMKDTCKRCGLDTTKFKFCPTDGAPHSGVAIESQRALPRDFNPRPVQQKESDDLIPPSPKGKFRGDKNEQLAKVVNTSQGQDFVPPSPRGTGGGSRVATTKPAASITGSSSSAVASPPKFTTSSTVKSAEPKMTQSDAEDLIPPSPKGRFKAESNSTLSEVVKGSEGEVLVPPSPKGVTAKGRVKASS